MDLETKRQTIDSAITNITNGHQDLTKTPDSSIMDADRRQDRSTPYSEAGEDRDEPDSMAAVSLTRNKPMESDRMHMQNGYLSAEEDVDEEGKLIIDDNNKVASRRDRRSMGNGMEIDFHLKHRAEAMGLFGKQLPSRESPDSIEDNPMNMTSASLEDSFLGRKPSTPSSAAYGMDLSESSPMPIPVPFSLTSENIDQMLDEDRKKKKKTRQEVDPGKYFEAVDSSGTKYACSQCGNIYKWRKSLNKHWKEKHLKDPLVEEPCPPGMVELLKSRKYTQLGARRIYDNVFLSTIKTQKDDDHSNPRPIPSPSSTSMAHSPSPPNFLSTPNSTSVAMSRMAATIASGALMPKIIGPFVAGGAQPVFPGMPPLGLSHLSLQNGFPSPATTDDNALDLTRETKSESRDSPYSNMSIQDYAMSQSQSSPFDQDQPIDFSKKAGDRESSPFVKKEKLWDDGKQSSSRAHRCTKCDFVCGSETEFANHASSHLNKRIVHCFECKLQISSMDELNSHFNREHSKKLSDYKEAIKKIPHGLQQTYHLLKMDLQDIGELGNQDLGTSESKSLKCKKCDFEAKWPAELQKHAVSHSEERPYICMVCGSTYKWKWDLVKHFQKSHPNLPNPYRRNDRKETPECSSDDEGEEEPDAKRARMLAAGLGSGHNPLSSMVGVMNGLNNRDDNISVEGIIAATQAGQRLVSSQPNLLDDEPSLERNMAFLNAFPFAAQREAARQVLERQAQEHLRMAAAQEAAQQDARTRQQQGVRISSTGAIKRPHSAISTSPLPGSSSKTEDLPYKCTMCNYHARWPSEVTQHMKNHSDKKPYLCPRCDYRSKWKWDVVKHLKRCGGGGSIDDVIDTTKVMKKDALNNNNNNSNNGPPNAVVSQQGKVKKMTPQPPLQYIVPSLDENGQQSAVVVRSNPNTRQSYPFAQNSQASSDGSDSNASTNSNSNNNDNAAPDNNVNNNYIMYSSGQQALPNTSTPLATPNNSFVPISNSSPNPSTAPLPPTPKSNGGEMWNCPHCPFATLSQAELKRHSGLHSEDKPFKCDICQYSTRWACDLKKHRKSYNHFSQTQNTESTPSKAQKAILVKDTPDQDMKARQHGRFKCASCAIFFHSLQALVDHRKVEHFRNQSSHGSPAPQTEHIEIDQARIKHPRKAIKQISCPKCPFVCKNRQTMEKHIEEHELLEQSSLKCSFCPLQFKDKESLLDHVTTHPAFNPKEWETFFMIEEEEMVQKEEKETIQPEQVKNLSYPLQLNIPTLRGDAGDKLRQPDRGFPDNKIDSESEYTQARIKHILDNIPKQHKLSPENIPAHMPAASPSSKYKCEWCPEEFPNLFAFFKHASKAHPMQMKEQDMGLNMTKDQRMPTKRNYTGEPIEVLRQQIEEKRNQQLAEKFTEMYATNPRLQEMMNKKMEEEKAGGKCYKCDKCTFSTPNATTFQRHYEHHGIRLPSQCWFCDYSVERMDLLYQHMKISHTKKWKALSQDPKYAAQMQKLQATFANAGLPTSNNNDSPPDSLASPSSDPGVMDLSSAKKSDDSSDSDAVHDVVYIHRQQYTWSGIPVNLIPVGNALDFVCPHCSYNDASIAKTCAHVMQSHASMRKYNCRLCSFAAAEDDIHAMYEHLKEIHEDKAKDWTVDVIDFKPLNFSEFQMVQLNIMRERRLQAMAAPSLQALAGKAPLSCPFCPFRTMSTEGMKAHVSNHSKQARFRCQLCDFSSDYTEVISTHIKVHDPAYSGEMASIFDEPSNMPQNFSTKPEPGAVVKEEKRALESRSKDGAENLSTSLNLVCKQENSLRLKAGGSGRLRYRCSVCPYHTTCKSNIMKHKRQHLHTKRYKCPKCSYSAARAVLLKNHLETHDMVVEEDGQHHDVFCDPNSPSEDLKSDSNEETEVDEADMDEEEDEEMEAKAIADLEAKDLMEVEAAHSSEMKAASSDAQTDGTSDKQVRKEKCPHCPFSSNSGSEITKHLIFHGTEGQFKCEFCSYSLDRLNLLSQHRKLHSDQPGFDANPPTSDLLNTAYIFQQNKQAEESMAAAKDCSAFSCSVCPFKTSQSSSLESHCKGHGLRQRYICDFCDWSIDSLPSLQQHRPVHKSEPSYKESLEETIFVNEEFDDGGASGEFEAKLMEVKGSEKTTKQGEEEKDSSSPPFKLTVVKKSYPCRLCPYKTNSKSSYSVHKSMHGSGAEFACQECSYAVTSRGLLLQHAQLHRVSSSPQLSPNLEGQEGTDFVKEGRTPETDKTPEEDNKGKPAEASEASITCQRCPFTCEKKTDLAGHMQGHNVQSEVPCPFCDFSMASEEDMFPHIRIHFPGTELTPTAMSRMIKEKLVSSKKTSEKISAAAPTRIYVCRYCDREFEAKAAMLQHEKQHLG